MLRLNRRGETLTMTLVGLAMLGFLVFATARYFHQSNMDLRNLFQKKQVQTFEQTLFTVLQSTRCREVFKPDRPASLAPDAPDPELMLDFAQLISDPNTPLDLKMSGQGMKLVLADGQKNPVANMSIVSAIDEGQVSFGAGPMQTYLTMIQYQVTRPISGSALSTTTEKIVIPFYTDVDNPQKVLACGHALIVPPNPDDLEASGHCPAGTFISSIDLSSKLPYCTAIETKCSGTDYLTGFNNDGSPACATLPTYPPPAIHFSQERYCDSVDFNYTECGTGFADIDIGGVCLVKKLSDSSCKLGQDWGLSADGKRMWVNHGCRATFHYELNEPAPASAGGPAPASGPATPELSNSCSDLATFTPYGS